MQRAVSAHRRAREAAALATVRFETAPGHQMQIDFGEKLVSIAGVHVRVYLFVAVLGYSRRLYVRASLSQRQDDWREGLAGAFRHFGGVPTDPADGQRRRAGRRPGRRATRHGCIQRSRHSAATGACRRACASRTGHGPRARPSRAWAT